MAGGRAFVAILGTVLVAPVSGVRGDDTGVRRMPVMERYLDHESSSAFPSYRALRRLEAEGLGRAGWLEAWTSVEGNRFTYEIVREGGSDSVRERVLHKVLKSEEKAWASGDVRRSGLTRANYDFRPAPDQPPDLFKVLLKPRRKTELLVDGAAFLAPGAELVRIRGRLASSPSFWVRHVDITREFRRIHGADLPVAVASIADIRFAGEATFYMSYHYTHVDGRRVSDVDTLASGAPAR